MGHYANNYWTLAKINKLQVEDSVKKQLEELFLNRNSDNNHSDQSSEGEEDLNLNQIYFEDYSEEEKDEHNSQEDYQCDHYKAILNMNGMCINVFSKQETLVLKIIDKIEDHGEKQKALEAYILMAKENPETRIQSRLQEKSQQYSLKEILKRIEDEGSKKELTVADLRKEVRKMEMDLKGLSDQVQDISTTVQNLTLNKSSSNQDFRELLNVSLCSSNQQEEGSVHEIHHNITHKR